MDRFAWVTEQTHTLPSLPIIVITALSCECMLGARHRTECYNNKGTIHLGLTMKTKHFYMTMSFCLHTEVSILFPFHRGRNGGTKRLSGFPKVTRISKRRKRDSNPDSKTPESKCLFSALHC